MVFWNEHDTPRYASVVRLHRLQQWEIRNKSQVRGSQPAALTYMRVSSRSSPARPRQKSRPPMSGAGGAVAECLLSRRPARRTIERAAGTWLVDDAPRERDAIDNYAPFRLIKPAALNSIGQLDRFRWIPGAAARSSPNRAPRDCDGRDPAIIARFLVVVGV